MNIFKQVWTKIFGPDEAAVKKINECRWLYKLNCVKMPENIHSIPVLTSLFGPKFQAPATVDLRDYCTQTENQGSRPWCAAYTAAGFAENVLWRKRDYIEQISPEMIYTEAKKIDGDPYGEGTTLDAVLQVLLNKRYFDPTICKIQVIWKYNNWEDSIKYAIHKFGVLLLACNITEEWYLCGPSKTSITGETYNTQVGGHAILCCGYNRDGVIIHNSWGEEWGEYGFALITWEALRSQFLYGAVLSNALNCFKMN